MSKAKPPLTVIYNGSNLATSIEVKTLKEKDRTGLMTLVDIAAGGKASDHGCNEDAVRARIHVRDADGKVFSGLEALEVMHDAVGLSGYFRFCRTPGLTSGPTGFFTKKAA